jgi:nitrite reductase/ring-hydroxylating ferredoxin subunit
MPGEFVRVSTVPDLAPGHMTWVAVDRERVLLVNVDGVFYALEDACGHQRAPLSRGRLEGYVVECPLHFARFDVRNGHLLSGPVAEDVPVHEVRIEDDAIYVRRAIHRP